MNLIPNWRHAWRMFSVQFVAAAGTVQLAVLAFPDTLKAYLPDRLTHALAVVLLLAAIVGRMVEQPKCNPKPPDSP